MVVESVVFFGLLLQLGLVLRCLGGGSFHHCLRLHDHRDQSVPQREVFPKGNQVRVQQLRTVLGEELRKDVTNSCEFAILFGTCQNLLLELLFPHEQVPHRQGFVRRQSRLFLLPGLGLDYLGIVLHFV